MSDLSIAIQHTPDSADRRRWTQAMVEQLRRESPAVPVTVVEDIRREGCWPTYRRALEASMDVSHHLVLQDDLALCKDFVPAVEEVIRARPDNLVALYTNAQSVYTARQRREAWIEKAGASGPAVIWPRRLIGEFLRWQDKHIKRDFPWDTVRVSMWLIQTSRRAFATVPSLVQHLGCGASLLGLNGSSKVATWFVGENQSALHIDWSQGLRAPAKESTHIQPRWWQYFRE